MMIRFAGRKNSRPVFSPLFLLVPFALFALAADAIAQNRPPQFDLSDVVANRSLLEEIVNMFATPFANISSFMLVAESFRAMLAIGSAILIVPCLLILMARRQHKHQ